MLLVLEKIMKRYRTAWHNEIVDYKIELDLREAVQASKLHYTELRVKKLEIMAESATVYKVLVFDNERSYILQQLVIFGQSMLQQLKTKNSFAINCNVYLMIRTKCVIKLQPTKTIEIFLHLNNFYKQWISKIWNLWIWVYLLNEEQSAIATSIVNRVFWIFL